MASLIPLKQHIQAQGWRWKAGKTVPYGEQIIISDGTHTATVNFYPKNGKFVFGGSPSPLRQQLESWAGAPKMFDPPPETAAPIPLPHIGMDESGKGDWFGPLVVGAVYVDEASAQQLHQAGVKDSKLVDSSALPDLAAQIESLIPPEKRHVALLLPATYNPRYAAVGNINLLLAAVYAETAAQLCTETGAVLVVCDQFSQRADRLNTAFKKQGLPAPRQQHKAESASLAVAAASILATNAFRQALVELGAAAGLNTPLPKGASDISRLRAAAQHILKQEGKSGLGRYAKLHFAPIQELLAQG